MDQGPSKEYKLSIDPRILELLGPNLYTNIYYVLAELIANAYDANAKNVYITADKSSISVEDDGNGMSYQEGEVDKFLNVAHETRTNDEDSFVSGSDSKRRKMGRKGVGKLAALSVSENVQIKTIKNGEKSGFILSRKIGTDQKLIPIDENEINFLHVNDHGTAIVMEAPQYDIHKTLKAARNNLLRIFPHINEDFRIHLQIEKQKTIIDSHEQEIIQGLACLITLGGEFTFLHNHFDCQLQDTTEEQKKILNIKRDKHPHRLKLTRKDGTESEYLLEIKGWIGAYRSTSGRKKNQVDFPDNFISIHANNKLGEFNILPIVGKNSLNEVYIVGQLHIDLFEESTLPDMALSNRQGYKSDDVRYIVATNHIRTNLLPEIINLRSKYTALKNQAKDKEKHNKKIDLEETLKQGINAFKHNASSSAAKNIAQEISENKNIEIAQLENFITRAINATLPDMGIKSKIDSGKKKLLISHASANKPITDFIYNLLEYSGVPSEAIIYTSNDDATTRIPEPEGLYDYLREFFVNSYSTEKIYVLYVTSDEMAKSWPCVSEVGAGWILKSHHQIFNINDHQPQQPLDIHRIWASIKYVKDDNKIHFNLRQADTIAEKIIHICETLKFKHQSKENILTEIKRVSIISD